MDTTPQIRTDGGPKAWNELTESEISAKLSRSSEDIAAGRTYSQDQLDAQMKGHGPTET